MVEPLTGAAVAGAFAHRDHFRGIVLMRAFGPNGFSFAEVEAKPCFRDSRILRGTRAQVHLHAALRLVVPRDMIEARQILDRQLASCVESFLRVADCAEDTRASLHA